MANLQAFFDHIVGLVKDLEANVDNDEKKQLLVVSINDLTEFACLNADDKYLVNRVFQFLVTLFYRVGELDYDSVETVLDSLTLARSTIRDIIEDSGS